MSETAIRYRYQTRGSAPNTCTVTVLCGGTPPKCPRSVARTPPFRATKVIVTTPEKLTAERLRIWTVRLHGLLPTAATAQPAGSEPEGRLPTRAGAGVPMGARAAGAGVGCMAGAVDRG